MDRPGRGVEGASRRSENAAAGPPRRLGTRHITRPSSTTTCSRAPPAHRSTRPGSTPRTRGRSRPRSTGRRRTGTRRSTRASRLTTNATGRPRPARRRKERRERSFQQRLDDSFRYSSWEWVSCSGCVGACTRTTPTDAPNAACPPRGVEVERGATGARRRREMRFAPACRGARSFSVQMVHTHSHACGRVRVSRPTGGPARMMAAVSCVTDAETASRRRTGAHSIARFTSDVPVDASGVESGTPVQYRHGQRSGVRFPGTSRSAGSSGPGSAQQHDPHPDDSAGSSAESAVAHDPAASNANPTPHPPPGVHRHATLNAPVPSRREKTMASVTRRRPMRLTLSARHVPVARPQRGIHTRYIPRRVHPTPDA